MALTTSCARLPRHRKASHSPTRRRTRAARLRRQIHNTAVRMRHNYAFAPGMDAMRSLYAGGHLAVVAGVGLPKAETNPLSHLNGQLDWLTGQINVGATPPSGWLGLTLEARKRARSAPAASLGGSTLLLSTPQRPGPGDNSADGLFRRQLRHHRRLERADPAYTESAYSPAEHHRGRSTRPSSPQRSPTSEPCSIRQTPEGQELPRADLSGLPAARYRAADHRPAPASAATYAVQGGYDNHSSQAM